MDKNEGFQRRWRGKKYQFPKIPGFVWRVKYDSKTLGVYVDYLNTEKKLPFLEITRLRVEGAQFCWLT